MSMGCGIVRRSAVIGASVAAGFYCSIAVAQNAEPQVSPPQITQPQATQPQVTQPQLEQPLTAPPQNDPIKAMVGNWELSNADHDKVCRLSFRTDPVAAGYKIDVDKNCPNIFPSTKDITAWSVDNYGNLRLTDAQGNAVLELSQVESGIFDGFQPEQGRYILQAAAAAPVRSAEQMVGEWAIARGTGKPICTLTLTNAAAAASVPAVPAGASKPSDVGNLALKVKPGCDVLVTRFGPISWRMESGELILVSPRGQIWHFEENDSNTWQRLPETPDPVLLVRQ
jgi:hypothetical protein